MRIALFVSFLLLFVSGRAQSVPSPASALPSGYMSVARINAFADSLTNAHPLICKKFTFGSSVEGNELYALKISLHPENDDAEPSLLLDGGIHGNELLGPEILVRFAGDLTSAYGQDSLLTDLINSREIWIFFMVNPDGRNNNTRNNSNDVDCNRDAGYMWNAGGNSSDAFSQPESKALRDCILKVDPVIFTDYHSGYQMISCPWSYRSSATNDWQMIDHLASVYSQSAGYSPPLPYGPGYHILYQSNGSFKDFFYGSLGNPGWSIEVSTDNQPPASQIQEYYLKNKPAMLEMLNKAGEGIRGVVTDQETGKPVAATIWVDNLYPVNSRVQNGFFHKYLIPGTYSVRISANGYEDQIFQNVVVPDSGSAALQITLTPQSGHFAQQVIACQVPINDFSGFNAYAYTPGTLGPPDGLRYSLWPHGWIILDMGKAVKNNPGNDLRITEGDSVAEGFVLYGGKTCDGPWLEIGTGNGTSEFDLADAGIDSLQYLKILDNGTGDTTGIFQGFDLDAAEVISFPVAVHEKAADHLVIYPNPSDGKITINWNYDLPSNLSLLSSEGASVFSEILTQNQQNIDLSSLKKGIYFLQIRSSRNFITRKIILL